MMVAAVLAILSRGTAPSRSRPKLGTPRRLAGVPAARLVAVIGRASGVPGAVAIRLGLVAGLAAAGFPAFAQSAGPPPVEEIRQSIDGAGPSHLFWLMASADGLGDYVGVVDPLFSAIRYYRVDRGEAALPLRIKPLGACALPPTSMPGEGLRPWRILHQQDAVLIEAAPRPGGGRADAHKTSAAALTSATYRIARSLDLEAVAKTGARLVASEVHGVVAPWNPTHPGNVPCGTWSGESRPASSAPFEIWGARVGSRAGLMQGQATITLKPRALGGAGQFSIGVRGSILSASPLEPSDGFRNILVTTTDRSEDGILRTYRSIVSVAPGRRSGALPIVTQVDASALRSKMGMQPFSVLPSGELLMMGREFGSTMGFRLWSCGLLRTLRAAGAAPFKSCSVRAEAALANSPSSASPASEPLEPAASAETSPADGKITADMMFERTFEARSVEWSFDASKIPSACRNSKGCDPAGAKPAYIPPASQRLTFGAYRRRGLPYAQGNPLSAADFEAQAGGFEAAVAAIDKGLPASVIVTPGNLDDDFKGDGGIDCSALIALAWTNDLAHQADTGTIQMAGDAHICPTRVPYEQLAYGDAINIRLYNASGAKVSNHVVLFAQRVYLDGGNAYLQVLESSSSCDGTCWSFYDPSFFSGWGAYRRRDVKGQPCAEDRIRNSIAVRPFPAEMAAWRTYLDVAR